MKIEDIRTSFTVYLIASEMQRLEGVAESLRLAGYMAASFTELTSAFSEFPSNPPHFLLFDCAEKRFQMNKAIKQVSAQLPESHVFLLTPIERRAEFVPLLDEGVYDLIYTPLAAPIELLRALDRAAERDYFMYMNERLSESAQQQEAKVSVADEVTNVVAGASALGTPSDAEPSLGYARALFQSSSADAAIQVYLRSVSQTMSDCGGVFFKYYANRRVLLASQAIHLEQSDLSGLGVDFNADGDKSFRAQDLRDPASVHLLVQLIHDVFGTDQFIAYPVEALGEIQGIAVFLSGEPPSALMQVLHDWLTLLNRAIGGLEAQRRLHVAAIRDPVTELLNRANFLAKTENEISRARRTNLPVSQLQIAVDQFGHIVSQLGPEEGNTVLRVLARIIEKHSRVNDVIGRTGTDEFGLLLPHTSLKGAKIKAERLRQLIESADFSKVLSTFPRLTVSIGISEYPSLVRDADELLQTAYETLDVIRKRGNTAAVAEAPKGFTPDFEVR